MLGAKDRVAELGPALQVTPVSHLETEASYTFTQSHTRSDYGTYVIETSITKEEQTGPLKLQYDLYLATKDDPTLDVRLTKVKPAAYGAFAGLKLKRYVEIEGDIVKVTPQEAK